MRAIRGGREHLAAVYRDLGYTHGAEIGVRAGEYSKILCETLPGLNLFCIDPWGRHNTVSQEKQDIFFEQAKTLATTFNIKILRMTSKEALSYVPDRSLDFVFVDGDHEFDYVCPDIIYWSKKVKRGGIISVHDYCVHLKGGVIQAVDAYTHCHNITPWFISSEPTPTAFWVNP